MKQNKYSRNTDQEGREGGQLAKTEVRTRMWFTCNKRVEVMTQNHKCHKWYKNQENVPSKYLLKINMYPMLIPLNS